MGENPFFHSHARHRLDDHPRPVSAKEQRPADQTNGEEEEYTIKCICGYSDDDGHTTLCEQCNTWQHVDCYYHDNNGQVPEVHQCGECAPGQTLDSQGAALRQRQQRALSHNNDERKAKRAAPKGHRKSRTKDLSSVSFNHVNGFSRHDSPDGHGSRSPHDYMPPFKRAKTHHRDLGPGPEIFVDTNGMGLVRQPPPRSAARPPLSECPPDYFSPAFIRAHQADPNFQLAQPGEQNDHDIAVVNEMGTWLDDPEAFASVTGGRHHNEILQRYGGSWREHQPPIQKVDREDTSTKFHGAYPVWTHLLASRPIHKGELVGELIGEIGKREHYMADPDNEWDRLKHPDHFVFFHPQLPIYIDCRSRGSLLRFARRGCYSNVKLCTFIEDRHWRFAFASTKEIPEGQEVVVDWNLVDGNLLDCLGPLALGQRLEPAQEDYITGWANTVLAHFGGCACENQSDPKRAVCRFDRRLVQHESHSREDHLHDSSRRRLQSPMKSEAGHHPRGLAQSKSPTLDTHQEGEDAVSSSRSSPSGTSRDQTPGTNGASAQHNGLGTEPSEREKKKMQQQAQIMEKMDREQLKAQMKKKRRSGSNPNTPIGPAPKHIHNQLLRPSASHPNTPAPGPKSSRAKPGSHFNHPNHELPSRTASESPLKRSSGQTPSAPPRTKPIYVDAGVQTQPQEMTESSSREMLAHRRPYKPLSQRLLRRNHLLRVAQIQERSSEPSVPTLAPEGPESTELPLTEAVGAEPYSADSDIQMEIETTPSESPPHQAPKATSMPPTPEATVIDQGPFQESVQESHPPPEPPPPPVNPPSPTAEKENVPSDILSKAPAPAPVHVLHAQRPPNLRVDLPPPLFPQSTSPKVENSTLTGSITGNLTQSPGSSGSPQFAAPVAPMGAPMLTPTTPSIAQPSPVRKKMSLADYSKRRASQAQTPGADRRPSFDHHPGTSSPSAGSDRPATPSAILASPPSVRSEDVSTKKEPETDA